MQSYSPRLVCTAGTCSPINTRGIMAATVRRLARVLWPKAITRHLSEKTSMPQPNLFSMVMPVLMWIGGGSVGGMQDPPGHRNNINSPLFREIGVGVVDGSN